MSEPQIDSERCVHAQFASASCDACACSCPQDALVLSESGLGIVEDACDGCGLCEPVCPEAAIDAAPTPETRGTALFVGCDVTGTADSGCVHRIGLRALAEAYATGVRRLVRPETPCTDCARHPQTTISDALSELNLLLETRGAAPMREAVLERSAWFEARENFPDAPTGPSRRALFRLAAERFHGAAAPDPAAIRLPEARSIAVFAFVPRIDAAACVACDACIRICPHSALRDLGIAYGFEPAACTGCGLCADACEADAIRIERFGKAPAAVGLTSRDCRACGAGYRQVEGREDDGHCRVCARRNHAGELFQVHGE